MFSEPWVSHFGDATRKIQGQDKRQISPLPPASPSCWHHDHQVIQNRAPRFYKEDPSESRLELNSSFSCHICICCCSVAKSCPTLCDPMDCSPPGSPVHGIILARILEWVAISFSRGSSWPRDRTRVSCIVGRFLTIWTMKEAHQWSNQAQNLVLWNPGRQ